MKIRRLLTFAILSALVCGLLNTGNFGTIDTAKRLQVARWIRLGEPPVAPEDTSFGLIGKGGNRQAWYGIGQSLVLVPFDALVTGLALPRLSRFVPDPEKQRQLAMLLIAFAMQCCITWCALVLADKVLHRFHFDVAARLAGVLALLFGTTLLYYTQSAQENNLLLVLALLGLYCGRRWQQDGGARWAAIAGAACGFAILVRLPSVLETAVLCAFALSLRPEAKRFLVPFGLPVLCGLAVDRWYQWFRFGDLFGTYMGVLGRQARPADAPATFPFSYPFWKGFWGTLFSKDKSIFLFDPLLLVLLIVLAWKWSSVRREMRIAILCLSALLLLYAGVYATYFDFGGDIAWAHRFVTLPVQLLCLFSVPLLLSFGQTIPLAPRRIAWGIVGVSVVLQLASTAVAANLEVFQRDLGYGHGVIVDRASNLIRMVHGHAIQGASEIPVEWQRLCYLPFQLRFRFPALARFAIAAWSAGLVCLCGLVLALLANIRKDRNRMTGAPTVSNAGSAARP